MRIGTVEPLDWITTHELQQLAGVHRSTARRWKRRQARLPIAVNKLINITMGGAIDTSTGSPWAGWYVNIERELCSPFSPRFRISAGELEALMLLRYLGKHRL